MKLPAVALLQRFLGVVGANFNLIAGANFKLQVHHLWKIAQERNSGRITSKYQCLPCCTSLLQQPAPMQQGTDRCARR
jgi:hypothetical protein